MVRPRPETMNMLLHTHTTKVLLVDDHPLVPESIRQLLEPHFTIVGTVQDSRDHESGTGTASGRHPAGCLHAGSERFCGDQAIEEASPVRKSDSCDHVDGSHIDQ